ncbi:MAG: hypothetical protein ACREGB_00235, partial [Candidatus Saccharimonadales bacterium]
TVLILALVAVPAGLSIARYFTAQRYVLSAATKQLIGEPASGLDAKLAYNKQAKAFQFNPDASKGLSGPAGADGDNGVKIGGSQYYGVNLAQKVSKGQTFTDTTTKLSFTIAPVFSALSGKHTDGHVVYPFAKGQVVYTLKDNGLREDVVLPKPVNNISLSYKLNLPDTLAARVEPDGSLGIYSASPALFGNITYGNSSDQQTVQKARVNGQKNNLVFMLPAPVVTASQGTTATAKAHFSLKGSTLSVVADGLKQLRYPITIDPSVVVNSASSFNLGNNEDTNALIGTSSVGRAAITGGTMGAWSTSSGSPAPSSSGVYTQNGTYYNGHYYVQGNSGGAYVSYATVNTANGDVPGTWTAATSSNGSIRYEGFVAYNGYLYTIGGVDGTANMYNNVYYAKINSDGSLGSWNPAAGLNTARGYVTNMATAYNGHLYIVDGCTGLFCNGPGDIKTTEYATINANGSLSGWTPTSSTNNDHVSGMTGAYNGYVYAVGGSQSSSIEYAPINANGSLGSWVTSSSTVTGSNPAMGTIVGGYIYEMSSTSAFQLFPIYANGAVGPAQAAPNSLPAALASTSGGPEPFLNDGNGHLTVLDSAHTYYASINPTGPIGSLTTSTNQLPGSSPNGIQNAATAIYGGYIYLLGGGDASNSFYNTVLYAKLNTDGSVGTWNTTSPFTTGRTQAAAIAYNGWLYVAGGITSPATSECVADGTVIFCRDIQKA